MGVAHDGGYAEYVRVPADWVVRRPESMTAFDAMTLGTAGFTAALAIKLMEHNGLTPEQRPGRGDRRDRRRRLGRDRDPGEARLSRRRDHRQGGGGATTCKGIGAKEVLLRQSLDSRKIRPLDKATWAGAIDNLGGDMLAWLLSTHEDRRHGRGVGLAAGHEAQHDGGAVHPARRRTCSASTAPTTPMSLRQTLWNKLAVEWRPDRVHDQVRTIDFDDLPTHFDAVPQGHGARPHRRAHRRRLARP